MLLTNLEAELSARGFAKTKIFEHFNLVTGASTGGIIALALALGIPAKEVAALYLDNAGHIFGRKRWFIPGQLLYSSYKRDFLEQLIRKTFQQANGGIDPRLRDCKTNVCIPIYDILEGRPSVLKNDYHKAFVRDYHIPAYQAAMATSAAPTFFDPYSSAYKDLKDVDQVFSNKVDGGVFANNPSLLAIVEAQKAFDQPLSNLRVLSLGTGSQKFVDGCSRRNWGLFYWILQRKRIIELFMQGQSQVVENLISLLLRGIDKQEKENFVYQRIETELDETCAIKLDTTDRAKLGKLVEKANISFQLHASRIIENFCND
jgi:hypothetical protein